jgi:hypothetical protein
MPIREDYKTFSFTFDTVYMKMKYGIIDLTKKVILPPTFDDRIQPLFKNYYIGKKTNKFGWIYSILDSNAKELLQVLSVSEISDGVNYVAIIEDLSKNYYLWNDKFLSKKMKYISYDYRDKTIFYQTYNNKTGWLNLKLKKIRKKRVLKDPTQKNDPNDPFSSF